MASAVSVDFSTAAAASAASAVVSKTSAAAEAPLLGGGGGAAAAAGAYVAAMHSSVEGVEGESEEIESGKGYYILTII